MHVQRICFCHSPKGLSRQRTASEILGKAHAPLIKLELKLKPSEARKRCSPCLWLHAWKP